MSSANWRTFISVHLTKPLNKNNLKKITKITSFCLINRFTFYLTGYLEILIKFLAINYWNVDNSLQWDFTNN